MLLDVPGELLWAAQRWAAVDSLSLSYTNPIPDCAIEVLLSDPTQTEPLHKLGELEVFMLLSHEAEHLRILLEGILSRAPHVRALYLEAFEVLAMPRLSGLKHLMVMITEDLHPCFFESLQSLESLETLYIADTLLFDEDCATIARLNLHCLPALHAVVLENILRESMKVELPFNCTLHQSYGSCGLRTWEYDCSEDVHALDILAFEDDGPWFDVGGFVTNDPSFTLLIDSYEESNDKHSVVENFRVTFTADFINLSEIYMETLTFPIKLELQTLPRLRILVARAGKELELQCTSYRATAQKLTTLHLSWGHCNRGVWSLVRAMQVHKKACKVKEIRNGRIDVVYPEDACTDRDVRPCTCRACKECLIREGKWNIA